jgi:anti-sigma28 factor (negative regulator of flagellin synthesis)
VSIDGIDGAGAHARGQKARATETPDHREKNKSSVADASAAAPKGDQVTLTGESTTEQATYSREAMSTQKGAIDGISVDRLNEIKDRVKSGFYDSPEAKDKIANALVAGWPIGSSTAADETKI